MGTINVQVDYEKNLTIFTVTGEADAEEFINKIREFYEGEVTKYVLWKMSECDVSKLSYADVKKIAYTPPEYSKKRIGGKTAIVAPENLTFGLSRIYDTMKDIQEVPFTTMSFRTYEEAYNWLMSSE